MSEQLFLQYFPVYVPCADEEYMCRRQMTHFRAGLKRVESELVKQIRVVDETRQPLEAGEDDRAEYRLLKGVKQALSRIEVGEYGYCDGCGVEIGLKRLVAYPVDCLCQECDTLEAVRASRAQ